MIKVWTNTNCTQCEQTKRFLEKNNIQYTESSLVEHPDETQRFIDMGFRAAPIVETSDDIWSGFRMNKLNGLLRKEKDDSNS